MAKQAVTANKGVALVQSVLVLNAAAANMRRAKIYEWKFGSGVAPANLAFTHIIQRCTTVPTGAAKTPFPLDPADTLDSTIQAFVTVDPTLTANAFLCRVPLNQQATFRWVAAPYGELLIPATANNGLMFGLS